MWSSSEKRIALDYGRGEGTDLDRRLEVMAGGDFRDIDYLAAEAQLTWFPHVSVCLRLAPFPPLYPLQVFVFLSSSPLMPHILPLTPRSTSECLSLDDAYLL